MNMSLCSNNEFILLVSAGIHNWVICSVNSSSKKFILGYADSNLSCVKHYICFHKLPK